jgi:hypothetical protein
VGEAEFELWEALSDLAKTQPIELIQLAWRCAARDLEAVARLHLQVDMPLGHVSTYQVQHR